MSNGKPVKSKREEYAFDRDVMPVSNDISTTIDRTTELLMDDRYRRRKTILNRFIAPFLSTLDTIAKLWDIQFLQLWIPAHCEYLTSVEGKARKDIVDITKYSIDRENEMRKQWIDSMGRR